MTRKVTGLVLIIVLPLLLLSACGDSGSDPSDDGPDGVSIQGPASVDPDGQIQFTASYERGRENPACVWYVDGVQGGSAATGTITQDNPASYTAPSAAPDGGIVNISVMTEDEHEFEDDLDLCIHAPYGIVLDYGATQCQIHQTLQFEAMLEWGCDPEAGAVDWYVNDDLGGGVMNGTITQTNPATYTAPSYPPQAGTVEIKAVSQDLPSLFATVTVTVLFTTKYLDGATGADVQGAGSTAQPFRTLSFALDQLDMGDTLVVAPGVYDEAHGEEDPFYSVIDNVTVRGTGRDEVRVYGQEGQFTVFNLSPGATLENLAIGNAGYVNRGVWSDTAVRALSTITLRGVKIDEPFDDAAIYLQYEDNYTLLEDCDIGPPEYIGDSKGIKMVTDCHPILRGCSIYNWFYGIWANSACDPLIEGCTITGNDTGVNCYSGSGDPAPETNPDLGGGHRGSLGGNVIQGNIWHGIYTRNETGVIYARFNTWNTDPPSSGEEQGTDFYSQFGTGWVWN